VNFLTNFGSALAAGDTAATVLAAAIQIAMF
jgi:hypothetical protein